jgi:cytochrome bd-type quinol oxidase subunit 1
MDVAISIAAFVIAYSSLFVVEMFLMVRAIRKGPGQTHPAPIFATPIPGLPPAAQPAE